MNRRQRILLLLYLRHRRLNNSVKKRKYWVHPMLQQRVKNGVFETLYKELRQNPTHFFNYFRMSVSCFDELHNKLKDNLQRSNTKMRDCVSPEEMLAVTIRYLASGCTFTDLHYSFRLGISTVKNIVQAVCCSIWAIMREDCMPSLNKDKWEKVAVGFEKKANFPNCIGAVGGKRIRIIKPPNCGSMLYNGKDIYSILFVVIVDSEHRFLHIEIENYEDDCSVILTNCPLFKDIRAGIGLPNHKPLPLTDSPSVPHVLVGDKAFALSRQLLPPFRGRQLSEEKKIYNHRLLRAMRCVECTFAILTNKWQIFHRPFNISPEFVVHVTKACVLLHNFVRERDGVNFEDTLTITGLEELRQISSVRGNQDANAVRNMFAKYFVSEVGSVPWRRAKI